MLRLPGLPSARSLGLPWRGRSPGARAGARRDGPTIAVIGNCQARSLVPALRILAPTSRVALLPTARLRREHRSCAALARALRRFDRVFAQPLPPGLFRDGGSEALRTALPNLTAYPVIVFSAFHPDVVYVGDVRATNAARLTPSPMGTYHSALVLFGHRRGLTPERILRLFRPEVFERLGYLDAWDHAAREMLAYAAAAEFDLTDALARWSRRGCFMHVLNHPKLFVLGDVARRLLGEAGLAPNEAGVEDYVADGLAADAVWPVYPPIAERYGIAGSYLFKPRPADRERPAFLSLDRFVSESVAMYRAMPPAALACGRVEGWAASPDLCAAIDALAR